MGQRLALVTIEKDNVTGFGLPFAQVQAQADPLHLAGDRRPSACAEAPPAKVSFSQRLGPLRTTDADPAYHGWITKQGRGHARGVLAEAARARQKRRQTCCQVPNSL